MSAELAARRTAAEAVLADYRAALASAPLTKPPGREWMFRLASVLEDLLAAPCPAADTRRPGAIAGTLGPFETEREVRELPAVRAVYAAFDRDPGAGKMAPHSYLMLVKACEAAGIDLGGASSYDRRTLAWLAGWEPTTCAVIAGLITRAYEAGRAAAAEDTRHLDAIRGLLARFDWEHDDRQLALEAIERIADGDEDQAVELDGLEPYCAGCGADVGIFIGHGDAWLHYTGEGTAESPVELYDAGHAPEVDWRPAGGVS